MSYIYSRALEEASLRANYSGTDASAPSSGSPTPRPCLWHDKTMEASRLSRFGMTCEPLTERRGGELLTSWLAGFRARTSAWPAREKVSAEPEAECGATWRTSLAKYDPASSSWKTVQLSLLGDSALSSVTWPRSGMTADGQCWELPMLAPLTDASDSGLWQTPVADDSVNRKAGKWNSRGEPKLSAQVLNWPTPTVCGNYNRKGASATSGDGPATAVKQQWRTPNASDGTKWSNQSLDERKAKGQQIRLNTQVTPQGGGGGSLNPTWVEWLMGWPLGQTDLKPLATGKSRFVLQQHGAS